MPWCEECARYLTPNSVRADGACPTCGEVVQASDVATDHAERAGSVDPLADEKAPWHFKLMVVLVIAYLGWRIVDLVA